MKVQLTPIALLLEQLGSASVTLFTPVADGQEWTEGVRAYSSSKSCSASTAAEALRLAMNEKLMSRCHNPRDLDEGHKCAEDHSWEIPGDFPCQALDEYMGSISRILHLTVPGRPLPTVGSPTGPHFQLTVAKHTMSQGYEIKLYAPDAFGNFFGDARPTHQAKGVTPEEALDQLVTRLDRLVVEEQLIGSLMNKLYAEVAKKLTDPDRGPHMQRRADGAILALWREKARNKAGYRWRYAAGTTEVEALLNALQGNFRCPKRDAWSGCTLPHKHLRECQPAVHVSPSRRKLA